MPHEKATKLAEEVLGVDDIRTHIFRAGYGLSLLDVGRWREAEPYLIGAYREMKRRYGEDHDRPRRLAEPLSRLYSLEGDSVRAQRFRALAATRDG